MRALLLLAAWLILRPVSAQIDPDLLVHPTGKDTTKGPRLNMDAVYDRPFLTFDKIPVSVGGYLEAKAQHLGTEGVSEGTSFALQRMTLFVASSIHRRIKFLSEVELEEGGGEIAIEFAAIDLSLHPLLNFRGGIVMNPIGAFNQNHDGPKWEMIDRPIAATRMLPATWSNAGFGMFGKRSRGNWTYGYEVYLTNGFDDSIISNTENRTFLPAAKLNPERFTESSNGVPLLTAKLALRHERLGEIGLSTMGGVYNKFQEDGLILDKQRRVDVIAVDLNTRLRPWNTTITGEWAWVFVDVPETYTQQYGERQEGGFIDIVQPVKRGGFLGSDDAVLNVSLRLEAVDLNVGRFRETGTEIGDDVFAITPSIGFRPVPGTVIRLNYRWIREQDLLLDPPTFTGGIQFGIASYF